MSVRTHKPEQVDAGDPEPAVNRNRFLTIAAMVLALALVGLSAWVVYDMTTAPETAVTAEIEELLDDYIAAWNSYDGEAFLELLTDDYVLDMVGASAAATQPASDASELVNSLDAFEWSVAVIGERIMAGDGPWYVSEVEHFAGPDYGPAGADGVSTLTIVDDGGTLKVARHAYVGNN